MLPMGAQMCCCLLLVPAVGMPFVTRGAVCGRYTAALNMSQHYGSAGPAGWEYRQRGGRQVARVRPLLWHKGSGMKAQVRRGSAQEEGRVGRGRGGIRSWWQGKEDGGNGQPQMGGPSPLKSGLLHLAVVA